MKWVLSSIIGFGLFAGHAVAGSESIVSDTSGFLRLFEPQFAQINEVTSKGIETPHFPITITKNDDGETWSFVLHDADIVISNVELFPLYEDKNTVTISWSNESMSGIMDFELVDRAEILASLTGDLEAEFSIPVQSLKTPGRRTTSSQEVYFAAAKKCRCQLKTGTTCSTADCDTAESCNSNPAKYCKWFLDNLES